MSWRMALSCWLGDDGAEMAAHAKCIEIAAQDRPALERLVSSRTAERRLVERARIVLLAGEGRPASEIADRVGCVAETARRQRARYEREGLHGLAQITHEAS